MGKGDQKSKRGKITRGTSGVRRKKKKISKNTIVDKPKAAPKKATAKKTTAKKTATKKATTKKTPAKKTSSKKKADD